MSKNTLREQRRQKRLVRRRLQRTIIILAGASVLALIAALVYLNNQTKQAVKDVPLGANAVTTASGLRYEDLVVGEGAEAKAGDTVSVHYTGWLTDNTQFDSSVDSGQPREFQLGAGNVLPGWDEGLTGMKVGGKRKLVIPPDLAYGSQGSSDGVIPPNAVLIFEFELLEIK